MFRNYLTVAVRNLVRHKVYSFINISGLAIGMACFFLILCFVRFESSYDRHHEDADRIYRVIRQVRHERGGGIEERVNTGAPLLPIIREELPGIEHAARLGQFGGLVRAGDKLFVEGRLFFADPEIFRIFTLLLVQGDPETALKEPLSIVLTPERARRYFGEENPLGKVLTYRKQDFKVTGILQEMPENSHFHADFLASFESLKAFFGSGFFADNWDTRIWTYVKLRKDHAPENMAYGLSVLADKYVEKSSSDWVGLALQPLMSIHLHREGSVEVEMGQSRNPASLYILSALGVVILLIACINFMSLTTARSATRAREVGVRKVIGGHRSQLIKQFLGESILLSCVALVFAFALMELLLPTFNGLVGKKLDFNYLDNPVLLLLMVGVAVVVGLIAGSYPAFFLSAFLPVQVLKGLVHRGSKGNWFRRVLVVFQFVLSVILIVSTIVLYQQHHFLTNKDLGFDKEHVISVPLSFLPNRARNYELFKHELLRNPRISGVTSSTNKPGVTDHNGIQIRASGSAEDRGIGIIYVDHDYLETLDIELAAGRDFSKDIASDTKHAILLNESAREFLGAEFGPGKLVELFWRMQDKIVPVYDGTIIGVVRDFNHHPLDIRPQPIVFAIAQADWNYRQALIRIGPQSIPETVHFIRAQWQRLFPDQPFRFSFLAQDIEQVYRPLRRWQTIFGYFALLAVFIACLGLFGLASFATEQRTKEIGIRKILGASVSGIVLLLSKEFTKLVLVSNLIAWPVAYYAMNRWLQDFAYRIPIGVGTFLLAGVLALIIALLTVSFQAVKAATANPVKALRYE